MFNEIKLSKRKQAFLYIMVIMSFAIVSALMSVNISYAKEQGKKVEKVDDIPGSRIGVQLGTTGDIYASDYENDDAGTTITRYNKGADAIQALKQDKLDCVIIDEQPALAFVEKNSELTILSEEFALEDYAICVSKENTELKEKINKALDELKQDGTLQKIIDNYIGDSTKGSYQYEEPEDADYSNGVLTMATNVGFPPYEYYENGKATGIDIDIATAIANKLGMKLEVNDMEFDSIIIAVQSGKAMVGIAGMTVTEDRLKNIDFTDSYTTSKQVIIVKTGESASNGSLADKFKQSFFEDNRWQYIVKGIINTLLITVCAGIMGICIGFLIALIRTAYERNEHASVLVKIANVLVKIYVTVFRGIPMMTQLLIMFYIVFGKYNASPVLVSIIAFGLNSGAYVSEAIRAGIIAIPIGQFEAGRSLGFTYGSTMIHIILPQALKNALPAMCNEFIALLKETSIVGYVGLIDLNKAGDIIRSTTYEAFVPLIIVALIYLVVVIVLTKLVSMLERRLKNDDRK